MAVAATETVPETAAPAAGEVIETAGAVVSLLTVTETAAEAPTFPAASYAFAVSAWLPLAEPAVAQLQA